GVARADRIRKLRLARAQRLLALLELGHQRERLLRRVPVAGTLAVGALGLRADTLLPGGARGLAAGEIELALAQARLGLGLACGDRLCALLEPRLQALDLELGRTQVALARSRCFVARP